MSNNAGRLAPNGPDKKWLALAAVGVLAVLGGMAVPQLVPGGPVKPVPAQIPGKASKEPKETKEPLAYTPPQWPEAPDPKAMLLRLGLGTAFVLALCVGSLWAGKHWLRKLPAAGPGKGQMAVVETLALGGRCSVHLVKVGSRQVLVGTDAGGLKAITPLPEPFDSALLAVDGHGG